MRDVCAATGKTSYPTQRSASKARAALKAKRNYRAGLPGPLQVYRCEGCNRWHLGHRVGRNAA